MPWIEEALGNVRLTLGTPIDEALLHERAVFQRLRVGEAAFALRHLFFAEREHRSSLASKGSNRARCARPPSSVVG
jgi:3-hydroxyacyl-CoA dehydrogenase